MHKIVQEREINCKLNLLCMELRWNSLVIENDIDELNQLIQLLMETKIQIY